MTTEKRIIARYHPQEWIYDNAVQSGPTVRFDVTDAILALGEPAARQLTDDSDETDDLAINAGIRGDHSGPFWVEVESSIEDYFDSVPSEVSK